MWNEEDENVLLKTKIVLALSAFKSVGVGRLVYLVGKQIDCSLCLWGLLKTHPKHNGVTVPPHQPLQEAREGGGGKRLIHYFPISSEYFAPAEWF